MASATATGAIFGRGVYGTDSYGVSSDSVTVTGVSGSSAVSAPQVYIVNARIQVGVEGTGVINAGYTDKYTGFFAYGNNVSARYAEGVYGRSVYGLTDDNVFHEVSPVVGTGNVTGVTISAASETSLSVSVFAEIVTDAAGTVGDEVEVSASATIEPTGVEATGEITVPTQRTINRVPVTGLEGTGEIETLTMTGDANLSLTSVSGTSAVTTAVVQANSDVSVSGVSSTGTVDENEVVFNNAVPTITSEEATGVVNTVEVSTTAIIFNVANKDHERTTYVEPDKPRIVYVRAA